MKSRFSKQDQKLGKVETILQISGYGGLHYMKDKIAKYLPKCKTYVEPFAGLGRMAELIQADKMILNDLSDYSISVLKEKFPNAIITQQDFRECIPRWDSEDTFFFCDPPWRKNIYKNHEAPVFNFSNVKNYYLHLFSWFRRIKGNWMITSDNAEVESGKALSRSGFDNIVLKADDTPNQPKIFGRLPAVRLCSNIPL